MLYLKEDSGVIYNEETKEIRCILSPQVRRNLPTSTTIKVVSLQIFDSREVLDILAPVAASCSSALCDALKQLTVHANHFECLGC